ncbi:carbohydrate ABC transporter permease [Paenibacillus sp. NPDC057967]|uniref:carbohydrate ABC transporter permease n=1 Tax=Paenibacillus sp. NPDC057967 TaxID=3346293 RepID=UPI0036DBBF06
MRLQHMLRRDGAVALGFLAPSLLGFSLFYLIPFAIGAVYSVQDGSQGGHFVGLANYADLLSSGSFRKATWNTLWFTAVSVPVMIICSLLIAMALNRHVYFRSGLRMSYVLPLVVPVASVVLVWQILFDWNGGLNQLLAFFGVDRVDWLNSGWARGVVLFLYIWKNTGYNVILFLAGLQQIPADYYEVASLEGASKMRQFSITLVYLVPTMFFVVIMSIMQSFKVFREVYLLSGDYPHDSIYMLQHYMNNMFFSLDIQKLTSAAILMVAAIWLIVAVLFRGEKWFRSFME